MEASSPTPAEPRGKLERELRLRVHVLRSPVAGPERLLVGGLHGREGRATGPLLEALIEEGPPRTGSLIVVPRLSWGRPHVSTLSPAYYETVEGRRLLALLEKHRPSIYLELHCYRLSAYEALTSSRRRAAKGVPPLVDLEQGALLGPISPHLASRFPFELSLLVEIPCLPIGGRPVALDIMRAIRETQKPQDVYDWLRARHGEKLAEALERVKSLGKGGFSASG